MIRIACGAAGRGELQRQAGREAAADIGRQVGERVGGAVDVTMTMPPRSSIRVERVAQFLREVVVARQAVEVVDRQQLVAADARCETRRSVVASMASTELAAEIGGGEVVGAVVAERLLPMAHQAVGEVRFADCRWGRTARAD